MNTYKAWSRRSLNAALAAVGAMLSGADNEGDWPPDVTREDLERAHARLKAMLEKWGR